MSSLIAPADPRPANSHSALRRLSVLVVDPHADTRALYRHCFERAGWSVSEAGDAREALTHTLGGGLSLIVTELRLPFIGGVTLCEVLRGDTATTGVPILAVTTEDRPVELERASRTGASAVLTKPVFPDTLLATATELMGCGGDARRRTANRRDDYDRAIDTSAADRGRRDRSAKCRSRARSRNHG